MVRGFSILLLLGTVAALQTSPIVAGDTVTFVASGSPSDPPRIVADFNGWTGGDMMPDADGRHYRLTVTLDPAARIEYLIAYKNRFVLDPTNPLTVPAPAGPPRAELRMPQYRPMPPLPPAHRHGSIDDVPFVSSQGQRRRIRVYVPAQTATDGLPIVYVHDGEIFLGPLGLPAVLDSLIEADRIAPAFVAFIDSLDRHDDYQPGSRFRSTLETEIIPMLERRYHVARNRRAMLGLSRSTLGALDACTNAGLAFSTCALLAPAIPPKQFDAVLPPPNAAMRVLIETGTYDIPLVTDARALRDALERRGVVVHYTESPEGHNRTAFRRRLPSLLEQMFPVPRQRGQPN